MHWGYYCRCYDDRRKRAYKFLSPPCYDKTRGKFCRDPVSCPHTYLK